MNRSIFRLVGLAAGDYGFRRAGSYLGDSSYQSDDLGARGMLRVNLNLES